jgi:Fur family peroxide stress response transcriptional regulator
MHAPTRLEAALTGRLGSLPLHRRPCRTAAGRPFIISSRPITPISWLSDSKNLLRIGLDKERRAWFVSLPMKPTTHTATPDESIHGRGLRMTDQRRAVYDALMGKRDHPTAVEVFMRVKGRMPSISLATVYNCLETLTGCGVVKAVNHDREPSRYCPNLAEHAHLFCEACGAVADIPLRARHRLEEVWKLPDDVIVSRHEVSFRGLCPKCAAAKQKSVTKQKQ